MFPMDIFCLRNICVDTLHKGDIDDIIIIIIIMYKQYRLVFPSNFFRAWMKVQIRIIFYIKY